MRLGDLLREAALSVLSHPGRSLVTAIGTILGSAAFVASLGVGSTLHQQVAAAFDTRRATEVLVQAEDPGGSHSWLDDAALGRLTRLNGVVTAGRRVVLGEQPMSRSSDLRRPPTGVPILGVDPAALRVMAPQLTAGRGFDDYHERSAAPVIMLSETVAGQLGIRRVGVAVFIAGRPYTVVGIYRDVLRRPESLAGAVVPYSVGDRLDQPGTSQVGKRDVLVETDPGAAQIIGRQAPLALRPEAPSELRAVAPPDPRTLRREIESSTTKSTLMISGIALLIGTISIGNATTASVATRTGEIGLRRAVGARRRHIFVQLVLETAVLGGLGGLSGALIGVLTTSLVSIVNGWAPVIELRIAVFASMISMVAGMLAGLMPAARAARFSPVQALQK
ncbi:ABC transporter [Micromonospora acroterricola]|uniref:ABC transporter n=2 Tax=Micromonospora acroterricola TaxID=2202421 RepID=A0A317D418_9ACTN|nr:ABC transporter [Micromonospora acroterricola]